MLTSSFLWAPSCAMSCNVCMDIWMELNFGQNPSGRFVSCWKSQQLQAFDFQHDQFSTTVCNSKIKMSSRLGFLDLGSPESKQELHFRMKLLRVARIWALWKICVLKFKTQARLAFWIYSRICVANIQDLRFEFAFWALSKYVFAFWTCVLNLRSKR